MLNLKFYTNCIKYAVLTTITLTLTIQAILTITKFAYFGMCPYMEERKIKEEDDIINNSMKRRVKRIEKNQKKTKNAERRAKKEQKNCR